MPLSSAHVHRSTAQPPGARGRELGSAQRDEVAHTVGIYRRLFAASRGRGRGDVREAGERVHRAVAPDFPELAQEIEGIAEGARIDPPELFAVNARTELMAGSLRGECSTIAVRDGRAATLMQNWDWHPELAASRLLWTVEQPGGRWFATFTEAGILAKLGLNSDGLALSLNLLATSDDGGLDGLPVHLALRLILERCSSVDDVAALLAGATFGGSSCITVMSADAEVGVFEVHAGRGGLRLPADGDWTAHTNHFLSPLPAGTVDTIRRDWPDTEVRLARVRAALEASPTEASALEVLRDHGQPPISVCCHDGENPIFLDRQETLASLVMRPAERELLVAWGSPCRHDYETVALPAGGSVTSMPR
jgi:isopenicillin-N N-acyltransferase like protein